MAAVVSDFLMSPVRRTPLEGSISGLFGVGAGANVTITNFGVIGGGGEGINIDSGGGVQIGNGGLVDNRAGATIEGPTAVYGFPPVAAQWSTPARSTAGRR